MGIDQAVVGSDGFDSVTLVELGGAENLNDVYFTTAYTTVGASAQLQAFIDAYKAEYNEFLQEYVVPNPDKVAHALARNFGWTIVPCGDTALNILGLSTQVPATWSYVSDGTYKEYTYDNTTIKFKRTTNKEISKLSYKTALVVQALKALGKDNIDDAIINKLKNDLTDVEKSTALLEAKTATSWIYEYIKQICKGDEK